MSAHRHERALLPLSKTSRNRSFVRRSNSNSDRWCDRRAPERASVVALVAHWCPVPMSPVRVRSDVCGTARVVAHLLGYARVSTTEQNPDLQVDELTAAGCWKVWTDQASGALDRQPQLDEVLEQLRPGDTLVVWRLDRFGRSLRHLIDVVTGLDERGVGFRSLQENIDTTTAGGRLVFHLFGGAGPVRAGAHPGPDGRRADRGAGPRPGRRTAVQAIGGAAPAGPQDVRRAGADRRADRHGAGVSRTSIYRALGETTTPAPPGEPAAARVDTAEAPVVALPTPALAAGAPSAVRPRAGRAGSWCRPTRSIPSAGRWWCLVATPASRRR